MSARYIRGLEVLLHAKTGGRRIRWAAARCASAGGLGGAGRACGWTRALVEDSPAPATTLLPDGRPDGLPAAVMAALDKERSP